MRRTISGLCDPLRVSVGVLLAITLGFYAWTAATSTTIRFADGATDKYNRQTDAFLHGQLSLLEKPAPGLARLPESELGNDEILAPYFTSDLRDLSLYHGRFYLYWGPTPVLVAYLPWRLLGVGDLPEPLAVLLFAFAGLLLAVALLRAVVKRFLPSTPRWMLFVGVATLAFADVAPFLLRRPEIYEVAAAAGFCFLFATLLCALTATLRTRPSLALMTAASLCAGLAFAARPTSAIGLLAVIGGCVWLLRNGALEGRGARLRWALGALGPFVLCVAGQLVYNALRFAGPLDFGQDYQLPVGKLVTNQLSYLGPSLWYYLVLPAHLSFQFPFFFLGPPPRFPGNIPDIYVAEKTGGILPDVPIVALLAAAPAWISIRRGAGSRALGVIVVALAAGATVVMLAISFRFSGASQRYEIDFLPALLVAALLSWYALDGRWRPRRRRRARRLGVVATALAAISCAVGVAVSITGYYDPLRANHPATFASLESFFSPLPTIATQLLGRPVIAAVNDDPMQPPQRLDRVSVEGSSFWLGTTATTLQLVAPHDGTSELRALLLRGTRVPRTVPLTVTVTSAGGFAQARPVADQRASFPVRLARGLNDVTVAVAPQAALPLGPTDPAQAMLARVEGYRLVKP